MIDVIIFSKNRPAQLDALLRSMSDNVFGSVSVLFSGDYSGAGFRVGDAHTTKFSKFRMVADTLHNDFRGGFINILNDHCPNSCTLLLCDDEIFYRPFDHAVVESFLLDESIFCFSLRLGLNTTWCYTRQEPNSLDHFEDLGSTIRWIWHGQRADFSYPWSVTGHVFRTKFLRDQLPLMGSFTSPNTLEGAFMHSPFDIRVHQMAAFKQSVCFSVPNNKVQTDNGNHFGLTYPLPVEEALKRFRSGQRLHYIIDPATIHAAHQEVPYEWH